uniref:Uncharacterized protein n=1 Tax=Arundo donax TaxID=35708 RepID=A0A0A8ZJD0_ARUDO
MPLPPEERVPPVLAPTIGVVFPSRIHATAKNRRCRCDSRPPA